MNCLLCQSDSRLSVLRTFVCPECGLVFKDPTIFLSLEEDQERYIQHQNNSDDPGYIKFLQKLVNPLEEFLPKHFEALDFGCGPGPTMSMLLENLGGEVSNFDPIFYPDAHLLIPEGYDVVTCTEVVEHFKTPQRDWDQLISLVKDGGILGVMTQFYEKGIDYESWWYKNDPTHVTFYQETTLNYLAKTYNLDILYNDKKSIIIFKKKN